MGKRIVLKLGTNAVMKNNQFNKVLVNGLAKTASEYRRKGFEIILITSGAIGLGIEKLRLGYNGLSLEEQQACAAVGQNALMHSYEQAFSRYNQTIAQLLLTQENFSSRQQLKNLNQTLQKLLKLGVIPIINENDSITTQELRTKKGFSDNDGLAALVALHSKADILVLASDVDGLFAEDPKKNSKALKIHEIQDWKKLNAKIGSKSFRGKGGFQTKLEAAKKAASKGIDCIICKARNGFLEEIIEGKKCGTFIKGAR